MRGPVVALLVVFAALLQVTVAPLFPVRGAVPDFVLMSLVGIAAYAGARPAMVAMPLAALFTSFTSDRAPGLLIIAYLPLLPLAFVLAEANLPLSRFVQTMIAGVATGLWARLMLSLAAFAQGAAFGVGDLVFIVILPGMLLDFMLVAMAYLPFRLIGWNAQPVGLQRGGWL
ncbi:MAG: hypothetical protein IT303_08205 [Dehalococcoidia bacterium]|nr:hypothetical protein [Dehalococcoidia bacterium]